jgi:hypothetical protein
MSQCVLSTTTEKKIWKRINKIAKKTTKPKTSLYFSEELRKFHSNCFI